MAICQSSILLRLFAGTVPYSSCAIALCTGDPAVVLKWDEGTMAEPTNAGYTRVVRPTLAQLFPGVIRVPDQYVIGQSVELSWENRGPSTVQLTGAALIVTGAGINPSVLLVALEAYAWRPGRRIRGRFNLSVENHLYQV